MRTSELSLPNYVTEPGITGGITDIIQDRGCNVPNDLRSIRWISSYQGETDYSARGLPGRLHFRWGKCPWRWSFLRPGEKYWNFENEEDFQREFNGCWGILRREAANPVNAQILAQFRELYHPEAVTGYFDHERHIWVVCEPTDEELSTRSWHRTDGYRQFCQEMGLKPATA